MGSAEGNRQLRADRRKVGLCAYLGCKVKSGADYRCPKHAELNAQRTRDWREKRTANG